MLIDETMDGIRSMLDAAAQRTAGAMESTRGYVERSKLRAQLNELYRKLGKAEYDAAVSGVSNMDEIDDLMDQIADLRHAVSETERTITRGAGVHCPTCGKQLEGEAVFCSKCGTRLR